MKMDHMEECIMFEFTESVYIEAAPTRVWDIFADVEAWWPPSNPEHIGIQVEDRPIREGSRVTFEEKVAGIPARASGRITELHPGESATWEGVARYRYLGLIPFTVEEGVCWTLEPAAGGTRMSARVWAVFPRTLFGRLLEWYATWVIDVIRQDRAHARCELEWFKGHMEEAAL